MRKYAILLLVCSLVLTACLESETKTTINADGSGSMTATVDFSEMMKMMAGNQKQGEDFVLDTTINIKNYSDTSSRISAYHKSLVRDMKLKVGSTQASFSFNKLISSSTAVSLLTFRFIISFPLYKVIFPGPLPT